MRRTKKLLAALTAALLTVGLCPVSALAAGTAKEEVVYINLDSAGAPETVDVVNIFELAQPGTIVDHGSYESVRNMTTTDPVTYDGETVTIQAGAGRLYYEGRMKDAQMPWRIAIAYLLDGKTVPAEDLAGASGALEIRISIDKNTRCRGDFFDRCALQVSLTLDTAKCRDIRAPGATEANVGGDKQLTYTVLPGQGADISLTARVEDFTMEGIAMNGVALALDVDVDSQGLQDKVTELTDAVAALDDGAGTLSGGVGELTGGAEQLQSGTDTVLSGAQQLQSGTAQFQTGLDTLAGQSAALTDGSKQLKDGLAALQQAIADTSMSGGDASELVTASANVLAGIDALADGIGTLSSSVGTLKKQLTNYQTVADEIYNAAAALQAAGAAAPGMESDWDAAANQLEGLKSTKDLLGQMNGFILPQLDRVSELVDGVARLQAGYIEFDGKIKALAELLADPAAMIGELKKAVDTLVSGEADLDAGITAYTDGVAQLQSSFGAIAGGAASLAAGSGELVSGAGALQEGLAQADAGAAELKEGTAAMRTETENMGSQVQEEIDGLLDSVTGGTGEPASFTSAKNTVKSVQFVLRAPAIEKPAPEAPEPAEEPETTFWQKLIALF